MARMLARAEYTESRQKGVGRDGGHVRSDTRGHTGGDQRPWLEQHAQSGPPPIRTGLSSRDVQVGGLRGAPSAMVVEGKEEECNAQRYLDGQHRGGGCGLWPERLAPGDQDDAGDDNRQRQQPTEDVTRTVHRSLLCRSTPVMNPVIGSRFEGSAHVGCRPAP